MTNLRFKEYTFRHNPRRLTVRYGKETVLARCYGLGQSLQQLGKSLTVVEGEGELFGSDAMEQFDELRKLMQQEGSGILSGAGLEPMRAVFESLQLVGTGGEEIVRYSFRFREDREER